MEEHGSSKPLVGGSSPSGDTNVGLDKLVKSPLFQGGNYGFKSHTQYYLELSTKGQVTALSRQKSGFNSLIVCYI